MLYLSLLVYDDNAAVPLHSIQPFYFYLFAVIPIVYTFALCTWLPGFKYVQVNINVGMFIFISRYMPSSRQFIEHTASYTYLLHLKYSRTNMLAYTYI